MRADRGGMHPGAMASLILLAGVLATELLAAFVFVGALQWLEGLAVSILMVVILSTSLLVRGHPVHLVATAGGSLYAFAFFWRFAARESVTERLVLGGTLALILFGAGMLSAHLARRNSRLLETLGQERLEKAVAEEREYGIGRLFDRVSEAVVVSDETGRVVLWNNAAVEVFGYSADEAKQLNVRDLVPGRLRAQHDAGMRRFRETGHGTYLDSHTILQLPALHKDGHEIIMEMTLSGMDVPDKKQHALAIIRDVTEPVKLREDLEAKNEALRAFTYVVSHDLKEPVRGINALGMALQEDHADEMSDEARRLVRMLNRQTDHLTVLLQGLLEFARASRIEPYELEPLTLREVMEHASCRTRFDTIAQERAARIVIEDGPPFCASLHGMCQVLGNLVLNSVKHHPGTEALIHVKAQAAPGNHVTITIEDNGSGYPATVIEQMNRLKHARPSTIRGGFGLVISRSAMQRMAGTISFGRSETLGGACTTLELPAAPWEKGMD